MVLASKIIQVVNLREQLRFDVEEGAKALLGCNMVMGKMVAQIVETEAYTWDDPGCHAYKKDRMKNMAMYGEPGTAYVYFTYGNHWMINVVADEEGRAGAVLIRAAMPVLGLDEFRKNRPKIKNDREIMSGPGRLTSAFGIDSRHNEIDLLAGENLISIVTTSHLPEVEVTKRIGIATGKGDELLRRYVDLKSKEWATRHRINTWSFRGHKI
jgi:DNA-3-methyladenine glycosylase